jgi:RNA polymerase primary sigma factor
MGGIELNSQAQIHTEKGPESSRGKSKFWDANDPLASFYEKMDKFPLLDKTQEQFLFRAMGEEKTLDEVKSDPDFSRTITPQFQDGFQDVFNESDSIKEVIANCNLRLVVSLANKSNFLTKEERIQEGYIGLQEAIDNFDYTRGNKFSTLATIYIKHAITGAHYTQDRLVRIPSKVDRAIPQAVRIAEDYEREHNSQPEKDVWAREIQEKTGLRLTYANSAIDAITSGTMNPDSLDRQFDDSPDSVGDTVIANPLEATSTLTPSQQRRLRKALNNALSPEESNTLRLSFGLDPHRPQRKSDEISQIYGWSTTKVNKLKRDAIDKITENPKLIEVYRRIASDDKEDQRKGGTQKAAIKSAEARRGKQLPDQIKAKISMSLKGKEVPPETRAKLSEARKGKSVGPLSEESIKKRSESQKGRVKSAETRRKISEARKGKSTGPLSEETKAKMSKARKGKKRGPRGPLSAETKAKMSETRRGRVYSEETKARMSAAQKERRRKEKEEVEKRAEASSMAA